MAENKQEKKTIQVGDQKYLVDDILGLSAAQLNNYFNFAREKGGYDDEGIASLRNYINKRLDNIKTGQGFNADGSFDGDVVENITMKVKKPGGFGKKEITQGNRDWANNYFYHLIKNLKPYQETEDKPSSTTWDISKHGLDAYLTGQGLDAKYVFENYDLKDTNNPDAARSFGQRRELLKQHLGDYRDWLKSKGFDFTKNDNEWDDNYLTDFESFVNNFDTLDNNALTTALRKYGAGNYTTAFTSDKWDLTKTNEDVAAEREAENKRKAEEALKQQQVKAYNDDITAYYNTYSALPIQKAQMNAYMGESNSSFYRTRDEIGNWARSNKDPMAEYERRYNANKMDAEAAQYILPWLQANGRLKETTIDGVKYVYDPQSINRTNSSFIAIDPITGSMEQRFLYDIEDEGKQLRNKYLQTQGATKYHLDASKLENGGVVSMQTGGDFSVMESLKQWDDEDYEKRAKEKGITAKELKEAERKPLGKDAILSNSGLTGNDWAQIATMVVNLGSIALDPISGGLVGAGASTADFINDIHRDGFQGKDAWNYVKNLGMDAVGMLPIIGDTFGTLGKVKKGLFQLAPKIIGYLGMAQGIANSPQIIDSLTKILDDREMTTTDWQNIANGLNLLVSGSRIGKHAIKNARAKQASLVPDKVQVEVVDNQGKSKLLVLDGDNAKAVRESDHSVESINKIVKNMEGLQDYQVTPKSSVFDFSIKMPGRKVTNSTGGESRVWNPIEVKQQKASVSEVYDVNKYRQAYHSGKLSNWAAGKMLDNKNKVDASGVTNLDQFKKANQTLEDTNIQTTKNAAKAYAEAKVKNDKELTSVESGIKRATKIGEQYDNIEQTNQTIVTNNNALLGEITTIKNARAKLKTLQEEFGTIKESTSPTKQSDLKKKAGEIKKQKQLIEEKQKQLDDLKTKSGSASTIVAQQAVSAATSKISEVNVQRARLQDLLNRLGSRQSTLSNNYTSNSSEFDALVNYRPKEVSFNNKTYKFGPETPITKEKLIEEGLYKQGGSIDKNKINKFLKYAKG